MTGPARPKVGRRGGAHALIAGVRDRQWAVVAAAWLIRFATMERLPFAGPPVWTGWYDQARYLASASAFAHAELAASAHWYPLLYPLLAAPFSLAGMADPFLLLDLMLFVATWAAFWRVARRLGLGPWLAAAVFVLTALVQPGLAGAWVHPWTTTLSAAAIWWVIDRVLVLIEDTSPDRTGGLLIFGALCGSLPLIRPVDGLISVVAGLAVCAGRWRARRLWRDLPPVAAGGIAVVGLYGTLHLVIYGPHWSEYMVGSAHVGFVVRDLGWKAYVLLVEADDWFPGSDAILVRLPWIVPGVAGLLMALAIGEPRQRLAVAVILALLLPGSVLMLTFADLQPPGLWRFGNIHYFKSIMPAFGAGVVLFWRSLRNPQQRWSAVATILMLLAPLALRDIPERVDDRTPARMLVFAGARDRAWEEAYFSPTTIVDGVGVIHSPGEFHQVPDPWGERAIAITRLFGTTPRRSDPGEPGGGGRVPVARYRERIGVRWLTDPPAIRLPPR